MRILLVSQCFYPEFFRVNDFCKRLVEDGHEVTVITGFPNYPSGEIYEGYTQKQNRVENIFGAEVHRAKIHPRHRGGYHRFLNYVSFDINAKRIVRKLKDRQYDLIFCWQTSPVSQLEPAGLAAKEFRVPLVAYCCDVWPESLKAGGVTKGPVYRWVARYSRKMYLSCDEIINVSPSFSQYHHQVNKIPYEKMTYQIQFVDDLPGANKGFEKTPNGCVDLLFAGNIGKVQLIDEIIEAMGLAKIANLHFHILGDGTEATRCRDKAKELGLTSNVHFYGMVSRDDLPKFYKMCDACVLPLSGKTAIGLTLPSKLNEYLAAGKPIIGYIGGDAAKLIINQDLGLVSEPDNPGALSALLKNYCANYYKYIPCGQKAREYYLSFGFLDSWMASVYGILNDVLKRSQR
jgi:glycosyltransferase involved in cell wall biosynthesis